RRCQNGSVAGTVLCGACSAVSAIGMETGDALVSLGASAMGAASGKPAGFATLRTASRSRSGACAGSKSPRLIASISARVAASGETPRSLRSRSEQLCPAQRGLASLVARKQLQRGTLSILARRLERNQPFRRRNGALAVATRIGVPAKRLEDVLRHRCKPISLLTMPGIELFDVQNEIRQERSLP